MTTDVILTDDLIEIVGNRTNTAPRPRGIMLSDPDDPAGWAVVALVTDEARATPEVRVYPTRGLEQLTNAADAFALQVISRERAEQKYADLFAVLNEVLPKLAKDAAPKMEPVFDEEVMTSPFEAPVEEPAGDLPQLPVVTTEWGPIFREMTAEVTALTVAAFQRGRTWLKGLRSAPVGRATKTLPTMPIPHDFMVRPSAPRIIKAKDASRVAPGHVVAELVRPTAPRKPRVVSRKRPKSPAAGPN
jgi:hypothetical protein